MNSPLLLTDGLIFDGHSPDLIADKFILIKDGRIATISSERPACDAQEINLAGKVVMPGLIDCHFHA